MPEKVGAPEAQQSKQQHHDDPLVRRPRCNLLGPTALGFRHRDDVKEITSLLNAIGVDVHVVAPLGADPQAIATLGEADFNVLMYPELGLQAAQWLQKIATRRLRRRYPLALKAHCGLSTKWPH